MAAVKRRWDEEAVLYQIARDGFHVKNADLRIPKHTASD